MSHETDEPKFIHLQTSSAFVTEQGVLSSGEITTNIEDREEVREVVADVTGSDPELVVFPDQDSPDHPVSQLHRRARRLSVAFSSARWKSSWDPKAPKPESSDPNLN